MYFVHVLGALLSKNSSVYAPFFRIRHIVPPYSLYYYGLLVLSKSVPMLLADRLIICVYLVSFVLGFRYLARALGPSADRMTLLATLLLLNWPLGMGFVNFCLALSFALWAAGLWLRLMGTRNVRGRVGFLVLVTATMLTHPVPLILLLVVAWLILAVRFALAWRAASRPRLPEHGGADLVTLALASLNLGYVKLFTNANPLRQSRDVIPTSFRSEVLHRVIDYYGRQHSLGFLVGRGPGLLIYHAGLILIVLIPVAFAARQRLRNRAAGTWTFGDTFLLIGVFSAVVLPVLPSQLNGSYYFADRLVLCVWIAFLLSASGWCRTPQAPSRRTGLAWIAFAVILNSALLLSADRLVRPAAKQVAALDHATVNPPGQLGILFEDPRQRQGGAREDLSWNPYTWALAHLFRRSDAVMANPPWMDVSIIPVGPAEALPEMLIPALQETSPTLVQEDLLASPSQLVTTLSTSTFFVVNQFDRPPLITPEPILSEQGIPAAIWSCSTESWYRLCRRPPATFLP